jgi:hypothetical protein
MHQGVLAVLRSGENLHVPAIIADTDPGFNGLAQSAEASDFSFNWLLADSQTGLRLGMVLIR